MIGHYDIALAVRVSSLSSYVYPCICTTFRFEKLSICARVSFKALHIHLHSNFSRLRMLIGKLLITEIGGTCKCPVTRSLASSSFAN